MNRIQGQNHLTWSKKTGLLLSGPEFSFQSKVHFLGKSRSQSLDKRGRGTESKLLKFLKISTFRDDFASMLSAGVGPLCFIKSNVSAAIYQEIFMLLVTNVLEVLISFFSGSWHSPSLAEGSNSWFSLYQSA